METYNRINNWEIIDSKPIRKFGRYYIKVKCTCGSNIEKDLPKSHLKSKLSKGCEKCSRFHTSKGVGLLSGEYWSLVVNSAKKRKLDFSITMNDAWDLYLLQDKKCALSGLELIFEPNCVHHKNVDNRKIRTASLDRIDSSKGYVLENIQWVHKDVNKMKNDFDEDYFKEICKLIFKNNENKNKKNTS